MGDMSYQVKGQSHQATYCHDRKSAVRAHMTNMHGDLKGLESNL